MRKVSISIAVVMLWMFGCALSFAQEEDRKTVSSSDIAAALEKPRTRGIVVRVKQKVDLNIPFEINSSDLKPEARSQLEQLEAALQKESLADYRFLIAGHTDASGSAEYNRRLSEKRAETVKQFLVERGVDPDRLEVVGNGEDDLLLPDKPTDGSNRRVEIRNLGEFQ